jgi:hypothetical protein
MHGAQTFDQHFGRVPEIGDEPKPAPARVESVPNRFDCIVRHRKGLNGNIANGEFRAGAEEPPMPVLRQRPAPNRFRGQRVAINRDSKFPAEHFQSADMIAVFMGEENSVELFWPDSAEFEPENKLPRAQSAIDQEPAMIGRKQRRVPGAAAAEHREAEHSRYIASGVVIDK